MKKFFALVLALVMALSLVACGDKKDDSGDLTAEHTDTTTVAVGAVILARDDVSSDDVYKFVADIFDNAASLTTSHAKYGELSLEYGASITSVPYHPGAAKYFAEKGFEVAAVKDGAGETDSRNLRFVTGGESGTYIEKPHSFSTACNIATQIIAQVASNQYGGQSISLTHLAPFVDVSRKKIAAEVEAEMEGLNVSAERKKAIVERRLRDEINKGVQTIQYQVVTLLTTNGQAPFITVFMYLNEARSEQEKRDLAVIIEEMLEQRYQGVKNEQGVFFTPW